MEKRKGGLAGGEGRGTYRNKFPIPASRTLSGDRRAKHRRRRETRRRTERERQTERKVDKQVDRTGINYN